MWRKKEGRKKPSDERTIKAKFILLSASNNSSDRKVKQIFK
jgi:hypothetical protein